MIEPLPTPRAFWQAQGMRAIGAAVVTASGADGYAGFLALSATHLTAAPPMMTVAVSPSTSALPAIRAAKAFAINWLAADAQDVHERFAATDAPKGVARFTGLKCLTLATGAPVLPCITGAMDCVLEDEIERFGTTLLFGRIVAVADASATAALVHFGGGLAPLGR